MSGWRWYAAHPLTRQWLHTDLPLTDVHVSWALSGAGTLRATVLAPYDSIAGVLTEWGTMVYGERGGELVWSGILTHIDPAVHQVGLTVSGVSTLPHGTPYLDGVFTRTDADPISVFSDLWAYTQSHEGTDLGVGVVDASASPAPVSARVGTPEEPYQLAWWEAPDVGGALDSLTREVPLEWREHVTWGEGGVPVNTIQVAYRRVGGPRDDLRFEQGVNLVGDLSVPIDGEQYASDVVALGAGEGEAMVRSQVGTSERGGRIRRVHVAAMKDQTRREALTAAARDQLAWRRTAWDVASITVRDHPYAPLGSWACGDEVFLAAEVPWVGDISRRYRIVGTTIALDGSAQATVDLVRADTYTH